MRHIQTAGARYMHIAVSLYAVAHCTAHINAHRHTNKHKIHDLYTFARAHKHICMVVANEAHAASKTSNTRPQIHMHAQRTRTSHRIAYLETVGHSTVLLSRSANAPALAFSVLPPSLHIPCVYHVHIDHSKWSIYLLVCTIILILFYSDFMSHSNCNKR